MFGIGREFTRGDRIIYIATYFWTLTWTAIFIIGTVYNLSHAVEDATWARFWRIYVYIQVAMSIFVIVWFTIGGVRDVRSMLHSLRTLQRDPNDDGDTRTESRLKA